MESRITLITLGVKDLERSFRFYHEGLGFPANRDNEGIVFFKTNGTRLAIYPLDKFAEDVGPGTPTDRGPFPGFSLAHNTRTKAEVDEVMRLAERAGGKVEKAPIDTFWGGYAGYFSDPDGFLWEVAWAEFFRFNEDGSLVID